MAMEAIQAVTALEEEIRKQKEGTAAQNTQRLLEAQRAARLLVEQSRQQAEGEAKEQMAQAEAQAGEWTREVLRQAERDCEAQKAQARGRLDQAAAFLAEKVVSAWQS